jgi:tetratricopeptide (TPR) repeat protein
LRAYRQALDLAPNNAYTYLRQAKALLALNRAEESIESLKTAFRLDPDTKDEFRHVYPELYRNDQVRRLLGIDASS